MQKDRYEFYCEELFIVKHKSSYSSESAIYFNLTADMIKNTATLTFITIKLMLLLWFLMEEMNNLSYWPNDKHIICNINNDIPVKIPSHPYVLFNRSILCNWSIEADNHHYLNQSLHVTKGLPN